MVWKVESYFQYHTPQTFAMHFGECNECPYTVPTKQRPLKSIIKLSSVFIVCIFFLLVRHIGILQDFQSHSIFLKYVRFLWSCLCTSYLSHFLYMYTWHQGNFQKFIILVRKYYINECFHRVFHAGTIALKDEQECMGSIFQDQLFFWWKKLAFEQRWTKKDACF